MADEVKAYLEKLAEARQAIAALRMMANEISNFARSLRDERAMKQTVPARWPTADQIRETIDKAAGAYQSAHQRFQEIPPHLRTDVSHPDTALKVKPGTPIPDSSCS